MIHPDTELRFISSEIGYGVVATKLIPKGTITWAQDALDRVFTPGQIEAMDAMYAPILDCYSFRNSQGNYVLCWDNGRYVNHSFHPSCITTAYDFELAVRDIGPGDQLTDDYGFLNLVQPFYPLPEHRCARKAVMPDDLTRYHARWDRQLRGAFRRFARVQQPLAKFLRPEVLARAREISLEPSAMDSILNCYYRDDSKAGTCP